MSDALVLVAVDGSDLSLHAARAGLGLLGDPADALIVTVVEPGDPMAVTGTGMAGGTMSPEDFEEVERTRHDSGARIVADAATALGLPEAATRVLQGDPGKELCALAADLGVRALIIGSRGRGGLKRALLGSVSDYVVRNAPCPVVITSDLTATMRASDE
jgi:nucleotide-binding universal stress UspA family protein